MRYLKCTFLCICFCVLFLSPICANADDSSLSDAPAVIFEDGSVYPVELIDTDREEGKLTVYTRKYGEFTAPFSANTQEFVIVNNIIVYKSKSRATGTYIPPNGCVISYTGSNTYFSENLDIGMGVTLSNISLPDTPDMYFILEGLTVPIDNINSVRDANKTILYNSSYGESTRTNIWGLELTVENNTVTKISDVNSKSGTEPVNNSMIPKGGQVISIHVGSPYYRQVQEKAKIGGSVRIFADRLLFNASRIKYAAYNPKTIEDNPLAWSVYENKPYDSFRGPDQLIVYDGEYGETTGTNPYGYEAAVNDEGIIIRIGGNDSEIPSGGYVLSGHGNSMKWLEKYAFPGARVLLDTVKKEATIIVSPDSYINSAAYSIKAAQDRLDSAVKQFRDIPFEKVQAEIDNVRSKLEKINNQVMEGQFEGLTEAVEGIKKDAEIAYYMTFESPSVENRAVWLRPKDTTVAQIKKRLDMLRDLNINTIYLETYWNGYAIYPTGSRIMEHNPMFRGLDVLEIYLKEAHARGMEVHAWVENFLVDVPVAEKKPEWLSVSRKGDPYYLENGVTKYYFLNPALPEVRDFLSELYKELVRKYNIDGIQFDYMRYSHSGNYTNDFGYDEYTRQLFSSYTGYDPISLKPGDKLWDKWCEFRTHIISSYAYRIISEVKSIKPGIKVSVDVWPEYDETIVDIFQNPKAWTRKDYINFLIPMSYYLSEAPVTEDILNSISFARGHSMITTGIASFNRVDTGVFLRQVDAIRNAGVNGIAIFEYESLMNGEYAKALRLGAFSRPSVVTNRNPEHSIRIVLKDILRKIDEIYVKNSGMSNEQAEKYRNVLEELSIGVGTIGNGIESAQSFKNTVEKIMADLSRDKCLHKEVAGRISCDLRIIVNIIDGYIPDIRLYDSLKVREFQMELPIRTLERDGEAPFKLKAVFDDNGSMYLNSSQFTVSSDNDAVEISEKNLKVRNREKVSVITIEISESFGFNTLRDADRIIKLAIKKGGRTFEESAMPALHAGHIGYTDVELYWGGKISDSDIAGYILYRNGKEILRTPGCFAHDADLLPGHEYEYYFHGFDVSGKIIYESNKVNIRTKTSPLLTSE